MKPLSLCWIDYHTGGGASHEIAIKPTDIIAITHIEREDIAGRWFTGVIFIKPLMDFMDTAHDGHIKIKGRRNDLLEMWASALRTTESEAR